MLCQIKFLHGSLIKKKYFNSNCELISYLKLLNFDICHTGHTSFSWKDFFFSFIEI